MNVLYSAGQITGLVISAPGGVIIEYPDSLRSRPLPDRIRARAVVANSL